MSQNTSHAVMSQRIEPNDSLDYFPTPLWATRALCDELKSAGFPLFINSSWEPACGEGHMARALVESFCEVRASDVHDYGYGDVSDFLWPSDIRADWVITNPPFRLAQQFIETGLDRAKIGVAMLVRTSFLEGVGRFDKLFSKKPPAYVYQFTERVPMHKGRIVENGSTATAYCWIVWVHGLTDTRMRWIAPCRRQLEQPGDYA